jgi:hypothetical protein
VQGRFTETYDATLISTIFLLLLPRRNFAEMGYDDSKNSLLASPSPAPSPASRASPFTLISPNLARMGFTRGEALIEEDEEESLPPTASNSINVGDYDQRPPSTSGQAAASKKSQSARKAKDLKGERAFAWHLSLHSRLMRKSHFTSRTWVFNVAHLLLYIRFFQHVVRVSPLLCLSFSTPRDVAKTPILA